MPIEKFILGTTKKFTWISSGDTPSAITLRIYSGSETLVSSVTGVSSGNGHYYANVSLTVANSYSPGFFSYDWEAILNSKPYISRDPFKVINKEND